MLEAARACPRVLSTPEPLVWIRAFGERSVEFDIRVWISDPEAGIGNVQGDILLRVWELFKEHGIGLPYPQRDIHIKSVPEGMARSEEHTSELQSLMPISYAVFCFKKQK